MGKQLDAVEGLCVLAACNTLEASSLFTQAPRSQPKAKIFRQFTAHTVVGPLNSQKSIAPCDVGD